ncbi:MAG: hypothetical protein JJ919_14280 [Henriciella sp.]|jgi:hypothetical protein|nr:hypothetical protein [Henriciella sp.]
MELFERFFEDVLTRSPEWKLILLQVLGGTLSIAVLFGLVRHEARAIVFGTMMGLAMTFVVYSQFGFTRIIGVGQILFWTPTLFYMASLQGTVTVSRTWFGRWLWIAIAVMGVTLALSYGDLFRYMMGDRLEIAGL